VNRRLAIVASVAGLSVSLSFAEGLPRVNPHGAMFRDGKIVGHVCLLCHSVDASAKPEAAGELPFLNKSAQELCEACHGKSPHVGALEHTKPMNDALWKRFSDWQAKNKRAIPAGARREVQCVNCHNPHPAGALLAVDAKRYVNLDRVGRARAKEVRAKSFLATANAERIKEAHVNTPDASPAPSGVSLPFQTTLEDGALCRICHDLK
jgi:hypothetical protein